MMKIAGGLPLWRTSFVSFEIRTGVVGHGIEMFLGILIDSITERLPLYRMSQKKCLRVSIMYHYFNMVKFICGQ